MNYYYTTTDLWPSGFCLGLPGRAGIRKIKQEAQLKQGLADRTAKTAVSVAI